MENVITRAEFDAYKETCSSEHKRLEDEDRRQNKRIDSLEGAMKEISTMSSAVEKLAINMENMCKVQERQGKRIETLESRDGEIHTLSVALEKQTVNVEMVLREIESQKKRLHMLEHMDVSKDLEKELNAIRMHMEKMTVMSDGMHKEQENHRDRLTALENRDGELWRTVVKYAVTAVVGVVLGFLFTRLGL